MRLVRAFNPDFRHGVARPRERARLVAAGVGGRLAQDFLAWRLATLRAASLCLLATLVYDGWAHLQRSGEDPVYSPMGRFLHFGIPALTAAAALAALVHGAFQWTRPRQGGRFLSVGIVLFFATPFLLAALPVSWMVKHPETEGLAALEIALRQGRDPRSLPEIAVSLLTNLLLVLPTFSLLAGAFRAGRLLKVAVPEAFAPGLLMVVLIPINLCAITTGFLLLLHLDQDWLLLGATLCLCLAQMVYLVRSRDLCTSLPPAEYDRRVGVLEPVRMLLLVLAGVQFAIFLSTASYLGRPLVGREQGDPAPWFAYHRAVRDALHFAVNYLLVLLLLADFMADKMKAPGLPQAGGDAPQDATATR